MVWLSAKDAGARKRRREGRTARLVSAIGIGVIACICAPALAASPALADGTFPNWPGNTLHVQASGPLTPGSLLTITATGVNNLEGLQTALKFSVDMFLVAGKLGVPCQHTDGEEVNVLYNNRGYVEHITAPALIEGQSGPFTVSTYVTLNDGTGPLLVCAFTQFGGLDDVAWASTEVTIMRRAAKPNDFSFRRVTLGATSGCWPVATTPSEQAEGLAGVRHPTLPLVDTFPKPVSDAFTMTSEPAPLTVEWIGRAHTVIGHWHGTPYSSTSHIPPMPITAVVSYPVGWRAPTDGARLRLGAPCKSSRQL
jgi:uncharacterized membrane protein (UPF0127 family)